MRKIIIYMMVLLMSAPSFAALTYDGDWYLRHITSQYISSRTSNPIYLSLIEIEEELDSVVAGTADTLDATYNAGATIDVDGDAVTLTTSDTDNNVVLAIVQNEATNDNDAVTITMGTLATGSALTINSQASGTDITGDNWSVTQAGLLTAAGFTNSGEFQTTADVLFNGTYDAAWDVNRNLFIFQDNAVLGIGGAHDAAADVTFSHDGSDFSILSAIADEGMLIGGTAEGFDITYAFETAGQIITDYDADFLGFTDDMDLRFGTGASANGDFMISGDSAPLLTIDVVVAGTGEIAIGNDADDVPLKWFGETAGGYFYFTGDQLQGVGAAQVSLNDSVELLVGTGVTGAGDFSISGTSAPALVIDVIAAGSGSIEIGNDADDVPLTWFGETTGNFIRFTGDQLQVEGGATGAQIALGDGDAILFGDVFGTGDFSMLDSADVLTINNVVDGTGTFAFGVADTGLDVAFYGDAGTGSMLWDENANTNGALVFNNSDVEMGDGDFIQFGDGADLTVSATTTTTTITMAAGSDLDILDTDNALSKILFGAVGGTHGLDVTFNGVTAGNIVAFDAGAESLTLTDVDLLTIAPDATDIAITATAGGANTASLVVVDGATGAAAWVGADDTGMVDVSGDGIGADAGATLLRVANSAQPISGAEGFLARFVDTGTARANAYAVEIEVTDTTGGLRVDGHSTFTKGVQASSQSVTATAEGDGTGLTPAGASFVTVTSGNGDSVVCLPTVSVPGNIIYYYCAANGFEMQTVAATNDTINTVDCDGTNELACAALSLFKAICVADGVWIVTGEGAAGADSGTLEPDAD